MMKKSVVFLLFMAVATIKAATFMVSNTDDMGPGSLRQAILNANATPGADIIDITFSGTVLLDSPLPAITEQVTIDGSGQSFTINGNNNTGVGLEFDSGAANSQVLNINIDNIGFVSDQGRSATGIIADAAGMLIDGVTTTNVVGENRPVGSGVALPGGDGIGIQINANNITVQNSTIDTIRGGNGSRDDGNGGSGGLAHGVSIGAVTGTVISQNTISQIEGGEGGRSSVVVSSTDGGDGGQAFGVFIAAGGSGNSVTQNSINNSTGGTGGQAGNVTSGTAGAGGNGGAAGNIRVEGDGNTITQNNNLGENTGGTPGRGGAAGIGAGSVIGGPSGVSGDAVSLDIVGSNNIVQSNDLLPGGNTGGSRTSSAGSSSDNDGVPGTNGGDAYSIRVSGDGNTIIENQNIGGNTGGAAEAGSDQSLGFIPGMGGRGGNGYGIAALGLNNLIQGNTLTNDNTAGAGGSGGSGGGISPGGTGGDGGSAAHMLIAGSGNDIQENILNGSNTGGSGGTGGFGGGLDGDGGDGGNGGNGLHMFITGSENDIRENILNANHTAGSGGLGGSGDPDGQPGDDGATFGILVETGNEDSILTNSIFGSADQPGILLQSNGNDEQVAPTITSFASCEGLVSVTGELNNNDASLGNRQYIIEFFSNGTSSDPEQGQTFIGQITVTTDASGNVTFMDQFLAVAPVSNDFITATATLNSGTPINNTSQFSVPLQATVGQPVDNVSVITMLGEPVTITLSGMSSTPMMFEIIQQPTNGTLSAITPLTGPPNITAQVIYTPNANFVGIDSFVYSFENDDCSGTVTIEVLSGDINRDLTPTIADKYRPFCNLLLN